MSCKHSMTFSQDSLTTASRWRCHSVGTDRETEVPNTRAQCGWYLCIPTVKASCQFPIRTVWLQLFLSFFRGQYCPLQPDPGLFPAEESTLCSHFSYRVSENTWGEEGVSHHFWHDSYLQNCCVRQQHLSGMGWDRSTGAG